MIPTHLADASAWALFHRNDVAARLVPLLVGGGAATCGLIDLEVLATFDDPTDRRSRRGTSGAPYPDRDRRRHPRPSPRGAGARRRGRLGGRRLIVAAVADRAGLILLHQNEAYGRMARPATGQPVESV